MKILHKNKILLNNCRIIRNFFLIGLGLMFSFKSTAKQGLLFDLPKYLRKKPRLTNLFVFYSIDCLFLDKNFKVVEKTTLKPFQLNYKCNFDCRYIIESTKNRFINVKVGDTLKLQRFIYIQYIIDIMGFLSNLGEKIKSYQADAEKKKIDKLASEELRLKSQVKVESLKTKLQKQKFQQNKYKIEPENKLGGMFGESNFKF
jgi:uncharacterized membrane protein (UPF0127 family)